MKTRLAMIIPLVLCGASVGAGPAASQPANDFSSPRATLVTYFTLVAYGDLDVLQKVSTVPTTPEEKMATEVAINETFWAPHLIDAMCDHFPKGQLTQIPDPRAGVPGYKAMVGNMVVDTLEDTATIRMKSDPAVKPAAGAEDMKIVMKKEMGLWKIVLKDSTMIPSLKDPTVKEVEYMQAMQACYTTTADDVTAGKFTAPILASKAVDAKIKAVHDKYLHPTVVPPAAGK